MLLPDLREWQKHPFQYDDGLEGLVIAVAGTIAYADSDLGRAMVNGSQGQARRLIRLRHRPRK